MKKSGLIRFPTTELRDASERGGIYIIYESRQIYVGFSQNLRKRLKTSIRQRDFTAHVRVYYWSMPIWYCHTAETKKDMLRELERNVLLTLHTIIYGHSLERIFGLMIVNKYMANQHAKLLPPVAWNNRENDDYKLGIQIAQDFLTDIGIPEHFVGLPYYPLLLAPNFVELSQFMGQS